MNTIGLGNALVDVLLKLENDDVLAEVGIQKRRNGYDQPGADD